MDYTIFIFFRAIRVLLGEAWKSLSLEEREQYSQRAKVMADEQKKIFPDCWKRKRTLTSTSTSTSPSTSISSKTTQHIPLTSLNTSLTTMVSSTIGTPSFSLGNRNTTLTACYSGGTSSSNNIIVKNIEESKEFYDQILEVLGARPGKLSLNHDGHTRYVYFVNNKNSFIISQPINNEKIIKARNRQGQAQEFVIKTMIYDLWTSIMDSGLPSGPLTITQTPGPLDFRNSPESKLPFFSLFRLYSFGPGLWT